MRAPAGVPTACGSRLLLLFQLHQGRQRECEVIWPQRLQEPLFDLPIQSQRTHTLAVCAAKLALVSTTAILGPFAPLDQNSAGGIRLHSAHSARSLAIRLVLCGPPQAAPLDTSGYSRGVEPDWRQIRPTQYTLDIYCVNKSPTCQWAGEYARRTDAALVRRAGSRSLRP